MIFWMLTTLFFACFGNEQQHSSNSTQSTILSNEDQFAPDPDSIEGQSQPTSRVSGSIIERHKKLGADPKDTIGLWLEAAIRAQQDDKEGWDALQYLTIPLKDDPAWIKKSANIYFVERIYNKNPSFRSFIVGSTPENQYNVDLNNITISIAYEGPRDVRGRKFMIHSSGANMPRPIYLQKSNQSGLFYIKEYSSMYVDVQPPIDSTKETFH
jgi:hypothetical protein